MTILISLSCSGNSAESQWKLFIKNHVHTIAFVAGTITPKKINTSSKKGPFQKDVLSFNHYFPGDMCFFFFLGGGGNFQASGFPKKKTVFSISNNLKLEKIYAMS